MATPATGISSAEKLPDGDYSVSHRTPPPPPRTSSSFPRASPSAGFPRASTSLPRASASPPPHATQQLRVVNESPEESVRHPRRQGSWSSFKLLRRSSSRGSASRDHSVDRNSEDVPPVPTLPSTRIGQAHYAAQNERTSFSNNRKLSTEGGRMMLRKSSKLRAQQELDKQEQERLARQNELPPRLPSQMPLPGMPSFGGDNDTYHNNHHNFTSNSARNPNNFSQPGQTPYASNTNGNSNMPSYKDSSSSPAYAVRGGASPPGKSSGEYVERHESMTNRGRYSYASSTVGVNVSSPRRVRRRKDPTPFNVLVIGAKNSGKTSFISFLRHSLAIPSAKPSSTEPSSTVNATKSSFTSHYLETEMDGERVGLTLWDSAGLEKNIVDLQLREMAAFVESKFEETFVEEQKVMRSPGVKDTHIHCVFLVLDPIRLDATVLASQSGTASLASTSGLDDDLDLQVMRSLWGKTTVIPVISKADTLTVGHMSFLKRAVWHSIRTAKMDPLEALELEDDIEEEDEEDDSEISDPSSSDLSHPGNPDSEPDSDYSSPPEPKSSNKRLSGHKRHSSLTNPLSLSSPTMAGGADDDTPYTPMAILSPDPYDLPPYTKASPAARVGRRFPWGLADPYNAEHCDFTRLRDSIFTEWRGELRELSRTRWYENWRTSRLRNLPGCRLWVMGGVTPVASIPREGRVVSSGGGTNGVGGGTAGVVPRSVSGQPSKAERMMGIGAGEMGSSFARGVSAGQ